ncbi:MAG: HlyD family efflux transporter periplasmic adaptor subunit [Planctomycetales bacterium]|nr:HlyD family efflux transporter periplasmic adaptor subunit [Planctomycetales bacterium]
MRSRLNGFAPAIMLAIACWGGRAGAAEPIRLESALVTAIVVEAPAHSEGPILEWQVHEGQLVRLDDTLALVDASQLKLELQVAEIDLEKARHEAQSPLQVELSQKRLALAEQELKRATDKVGRVGAVVSEAEVSRLQLARDEADLQLRHARHVHDGKLLEVRRLETQRTLAQMAIARCRVPAILDGEVTHLLKQRGEWVRPGDPVAKLTRTDRMRIEGLLPLAAIAEQSLTGRPVKFVTDATGQPQLYQGVVTYLHRDISALQGRVRVWAEVENRERALRPGMKGQLEIAVESERR